MSLLDNFKRYVRGEDYDSEEYQDFNDDAENEQSASRWGSGSSASAQNGPAAASFSSDYYNTGSVRDSSASSSASYRSSSYSSTQNGKVVNIHTTTQLSVVLMKPDNYQNVSDIADHLKAKRTVVLNLEETNRDVARRILDFLSGAVYATEGNIRKIANSTYLITPQNIAIQGNIVEELENNGLYV